MGILINTNLLERDFPMIDISPVEVLRMARLDKMSKVALADETQNRVTVVLSNIEGLVRKFKISIAKTDVKNHWILNEVGITPLFKGKTLYR